MGQERLLDLEKNVEKGEERERWFIFTIVIWRGSGETARSREECERVERWFIITIVVWRKSGEIARSREEGEEGGGEGERDGSAEGLGQDTDGEPGTGAYKGFNYKTGQKWINYSPQTQILSLYLRNMML